MVRFRPKSRIKRHPSRETAKFLIGGSLLCLRIPPPPRRFCNKNGFSLVELIVVILIIAILAVAVFAGGSAAIKKAHIAKATSDLHNFQIAVEMTLNESPRVANIATETKKAQLESIMDALNGNLAADYKLTAVDGTLTGNITKTAATTDDASFIICRSDKTDSWGNPYFVIIDRAERGGSSASEFYMTTVTAGPNAILHLDGAIDGDDVFSLTSYADGDVISAIYNMAAAAPTVVGGAEAATSYTAVMSAPVNNGVTVGGYVAPETPGAIEVSANEAAITVSLTNPIHPTAFSSAKIYAIYNTHVGENASPNYDWYYVAELLNQRDADHLLGEIDSPTGEKTVTLNLQDYNGILVCCDGTCPVGGFASCTGGCDNPGNNGQGSGVWVARLVTGDGTITLDGVDYDD